MRILLSIIFAMISFVSYSQIMSYNDLGVLFSKDNNRGTARFNAMSGAFGALGSDISSTSINPAGGAVANISSLSVTFNNQNNVHNTNYYGNNFNTENSKTNLSQAGALLVFDSAFKSKWNRFAMFFNYSLKNNNARTYTANAERYSYPLFEEHLSDNTGDFNLFDRNLYQYISNDTRIKNEVFNIGFSSAYGKKMFVGVSLKIHDIEFSEVSFLEEENDDIDENILYVEDYYENYIQGNGVSLNLGFIYKLNKNMRFGLAYETPTWYQEVFEEFYNELYMEKIESLGLEGFLEDENQFNVFSYKSASTITASGAYIFGKRGLVSIDYTYRDYKNISFKNDNINTGNENFNTDYRNTYTLKVGTEWRFHKVSLRGGASYEKDPNLTIGGGTNEDNIKSYSLGLGYNFGNSQFDVSYTNSKNTSFNTVYNTGDLTIDNNVSQISGTLTFNL